MTCCTAANDFFNDAQAKWDLRRYRRKGPSPSARKLLQSLGSIDGLTALDIGGGVGAITHDLLSRGAVRVTAVDASSSYLHVLMDEAKRQGHADRITTHFGDFTTLADNLEPTDIITLDRVLCCYEDVDTLIARVAELAHGHIGLVYPCNTWWSRLAIRSFNAIQQLRRHAFRVYFHTPAHIDNLLQNAHFQLVASSRTPLWQIAVYKRT